MSYILDALKKDEAARNPDAAEVLLLNRASSAKQRRTLMLGAGVIVALLLNAAVAAWYLTGMDIDDGPGNKPATDLARPESSPHTELDPARRLAPVSTTRAESDALEPAKGIQDPVTERVAATGQRVPGTDQRVLKPVSDLPAPTATRLRGLSFSSHIFADAADLRAVVVDGQRLSEGDWLDDVRLHRITPDGVVVEYHDDLVEISVLENWDR